MTCRNCPAGELSGDELLAAENCRGPVRFEVGSVTNNGASQNACRAEAAVCFEKNGTFKGINVVDVEQTEDNIIDLRIRHAVELALYDVGIAAGA